MSLIFILWNPRVEFLLKGIFIRTPSATTPTPSILDYPINDLIPIFQLSLIRWLLAHYMCLCLQTG